VESTKKNSPGGRGRGIGPIKESKDPRGTSGRGTFTGINRGWFRLKNTDPLRKKKEGAKGGKKKEAVVKC